MDSCKNCGAPSPHPNHQCKLEAIQLADLLDQYHSDPKSVERRAAQELRRLSREHEALKPDAEQWRKIGSHGRFWLERREQIISAVLAAGYQIVTTARGVHLMKLGKIEAQGNQRQPYPELVSIVNSIVKSSATDPVDAIFEKIAEWEGLINGGAQFCGGMETVHFVAGEIDKMILALNPSIRPCGNFRERGLEICRNPMECRSACKIDNSTN